MSIHPGERKDSYLVRTSPTSDRDSEVLLFAKSGVPTDGILPDGQEMAATQTAVCLRQGATVATTFYLTVDGGTTWTAFDPAALSGLDLNGSALVIDADGDTQIQAAVDDIITFTIGGALDFQMSANALEVLTGSALAFADSAAAKFGTGLDILMSWDGTRFNITQAAPNSEIRWGVDGAGIDQIFYGDTAGSNITFDQTADSLIFTDDMLLVFGDGSDISLNFDGTNLVLATAAADTGALALGADGAGVDVIFFGDTVGSNMTWDQSADNLLITDDVAMVFGDGGDILVQFDGTDLTISSAVADTGAVGFGVDGAGVDAIFYGDTASVNVTWDQTADSLIFADDALLVLGTGSDDTISHDGTNTTWSHGTGTLTLDNKNATGSTEFRLGADTDAVSVDIKNDSDAAVFSVLGSGNHIIAPTIVDMANAEHTMVPDGAGANQTDIGGPTWFIDPNGGSVVLVLPAEASCAGFRMMVINTADAAETVTIQDDAKGYTVIVLDQNQSGWIACDGTVWYGFMGSET